MIERRIILTDPTGAWYFVPDGDVVINERGDVGLVGVGGTSDVVMLSIADSFVLAADTHRVIIVPDVGRFTVTRDDPLS